MKMKDITASGTKFAKRGAAAGPEYKQGVLNPDAPWQQSTLNAKELYVEGVTAAIARGAFEKGVGATTDSEWQTAASVKGARNYPTAVAESGPKWVKGFTPTQNALAGLTLPPRGARNSPGNYERSRLTGEAASKVRTG